MTHVLVIAKDAAIANSLATRLPNELVTETVSSSEEAKERLHAQNFDLVIYDAESLPSQRAKTLQLLGNWLINGPRLESSSYRTAKNSTLPAPAGRVRMDRPAAGRSPFVSDRQRRITRMSQSETVKATYPTYFRRRTLKASWRSACRCALSSSK